ncbi:toll-like receptor Tollo [Nylanderia fulva]|uniref:toll-like receptor Tollo n=1 Tax=Nylanderia fulva TaxID=613905 RepID=UPI0010FB0C4E|nr:toll-like receptor Tollo [Nylanderia fulva]
MLLFIICFLPLVASQITSSNLILDIHNGTLTDIQFVEGSNHTVLDLSNSSLRGLEKTAFDNVLDAESLILADNLLSSLPEFVFSNLTRLRSLSLSGNQISNVQNLFVGLENLQLLDISRNPVKHFTRSYLFGLSKSVKILTNENVLWSISTDVFASSFKEEEPKRLAATMDQEQDFVEKSEEKKKEMEDSAVERDAEEPVLKPQEVVQTLNKDTRVKICKSDGIVTSLATFEKDEELVEGCIQVQVDVDETQVNLRERGIRSFQENWYRLQSLPISSLDLSNNEITEITKEMLNNLPTDLTYVNFLGNRIRRIRSQVIENNHLKRLNFKGNLIDEIEEDAFEKTKLRGLFLVDNQLKNLNFVSSLPNTLTEFVASENRIASIPDGAFSKFSRLLYLNLDDNEIKTLQSDVFQGLESLRSLMLTSNNITTIEFSAFRGLTALERLDLHRNSIRDLQEATFAELTALKNLNLAYNNIAKATFADLPSSVDSLLLDYNEIDVLEEGNFVRVPKVILSLTGNRITSIKRGAFNLPVLKDLNLSQNLLTTIEGDSYEGLNQLRRLWLSENKISEIRKGACKNLGSLYILDIARNPFQKLENGALHGLNTGLGTSLYIYENNVREMQGGVFDDRKIAMLLFIVSLLPLVASMHLDILRMIIKTSSNLILDVYNGTLTDIRVVEGSNHTVLDLSNFSLRGLERTAFENVLDAETLVLADNSITSLPDFVFSNLTRLRSLSLSGNQLTNVRNLFDGLENLRLLDISCNPIKHLGQGHLFGLARSVKILTDGNILCCISTGVFANSFLKEEKLQRLVTPMNRDRNFVGKSEAGRKKEEYSLEECDAEWLIVKSQKVSRSLVEIVHNNIRIKICKSDGIVTTLSILEKDEELVDGCVQVSLDMFDETRVDLRKQEIRGFQENWYQLRLLPISSLDLSYNNITEITKEMLNYLPTNLTTVIFLGNKIQRIPSQVIENYHLKILNFKSNLIDEIEDNAFARTNLQELYLADNQLKSLDFVSSLSNTLTEFVASGNHISSIPDGVFSELSRLRFLNFDDNEIKALQSDVFQGLESLRSLTLMSNNITTIELSAFKGLTALETLDLHRNSIRDLRKAIFADLTALKDLNLAYNNIAEATFADLPSSVESLLLDYNDIEVLEEGNFIRVPKVTLSLTGNRIASIKRGAFNLPILRDLYLGQNVLTTIEGDSYEGLNRLRRLWLSENKISEIRKGACKNLASLHSLDVSRNPFRKLENGALHGLNTGFETSLYIYGNNLKEIQGGVFDDI